MSFQNYLPGKKILLVPDCRTRAWITLSGHNSHTCNLLLIIIPKYNVVKEKEHCHEIWKTLRCACNNENSSKLFLYCWQVFTIAVKLFTVIFCPKQRQGNGLKLEIIGIAFLCCHFLLQIAKSTFVLSSIPLITVLGCACRYVISIETAKLRLLCGVFTSNRLKFPRYVFLVVAHIFS